MSQLFVALLGVVVGGLIAGLTGWVLDVSRDKRRRRDDERREEREFVRASRLVSEELYESLNLLCHTVDLQRWSAHPDRLRTMRWEEYEPVFAGHDADDYVWSRLATAYQVVREVNGMAPTRLRKGIGARPFSAEDEVELRLQIGAIDDGYQALSELADEPVVPMEPDHVAALFAAASRGAREFFSCDVDERPPLRDRQELNVTSEDLTATGIALLRPPSWAAFRCRLQIGTKLIVAVSEIEGTRTCAVFPSQKRTAEPEVTERLVPREIRNLPGYSDFILLLNFPEDEARIEPTAPVKAPTGIEPV